MNTCCKKLMRFLFSHIGLTILLILYSGLGALMFKYIEGPIELKDQNELIEISNNIELHRQLIKDAIYQMASKFEDRTYRCNFFWEDDLGYLYSTEVATKQYTVKNGQEPNCYSWLPGTCVPESCVHVCHVKKLGGPFSEYDPELCENKVSTIVQAKIKNLLDEYHNHVKIAIEGFDYKKKVVEPQITWTFTSAMLFTITILSVIGYGHLSPTTDFTRLMVLVYAVLGIPLFLMFLARVGGALAYLVRTFNQRVICYSFKKKRASTQKRYKTANDGTLIMPGTNDKTIDTGSRDEDEDYDPTLLCIALLFVAVYMVIAAFLFHWSEAWNLGDSFYFCFVSFTTIGFGDKVPGVYDINTDKGTIKLISGIVFLLGGLAVLGMGIDLLHFEFSHRYKNVGKQAGIFKEDEFDADKDGIDNDVEKIQNFMGSPNN